MKKLLLSFIFLISLAFSLNYIHMNLVPTYTFEKAFSWEYSTNMSTAAMSNSLWILIPRNITYLTIGVIVSNSGFCWVETTVDTFATISNGTATSFVWDYGLTGSNISATSYPVSAIRICRTNTTGQCAITIRAQ